MRHLVHKPLNFAASSQAVGVWLVTNDKWLAISWMCLLPLSNRNILRIQDWTKVAATDIENVVKTPVVI